MTAVLASGPIGLTDDKSGKQLFIPASAVYYDSSGTIKADKWTPYQTSSDQAFKDLVDGWLRHLAKTGRLESGPSIPPKPVLVVKAKDAGESGNDIEVGFSDISINDATPANSTVKTEVTATDSYTGLTPATLIGVLGTPDTDGSKPGLVRVKWATGDPDPTLPEAGDYPLAGATGGATPTAATADIPEEPSVGTGTAFIVEARRAGEDANDNLVVTISNVDTGAQTFDLTAVWSKSKAARLSQISQEFGYLLDVTDPSGGALTDYPGTDFPAPGTTTLSGGTGSPTPTPASATFLSEQQ